MPLIPATLLLIDALAEKLPLHEQMRWAAKILEKANQCCGMPHNMSWTPADLIAESHVAAVEAGAV